MRICAIIESMHQGGAERMLARLLNEFALSGNKVFLIVLEGDSFFDIANDVEVFLLNLNSKKRNLFSRFCSKQKIIVELIKELKPDVIFGIYFWPLIYLALSHVKTPIIASERSNPLFKKTLKERICKRVVFNRADCIIFQTESAKKCFNRKIQQKGIVIPNFIDDSIFNLNYSVPHDKDLFKICAVGSIKEEKDYFTLIRSFELLLKRNRRYVLYIYGNDYLNGRLNSFVRELGISNVNICRPEPNIWELLLDSSCYVLSSLSEGMPNALMEAMAIGVPSVSTNCNFGPSDLITNNETGILVPVGDYVSLANAIEIICQDYNLSVTLSENAKRRMKAYKSDMIFERFLKAFYELSKRKGYKKHE